MLHTVVLLIPGFIHSSLLYDQALGFACWKQEHRSEKSTTCDGESVSLGGGTCTSHWNDWLIEFSANYQPNL